MGSFQGYLFPAETIEASILFVGVWIRANSPFEMFGNSLLGVCQIRLILVLRLENGFENDVRKCRRPRLADERLAGNNLGLMCKWQRSLSVGVRKACIWYV